MPITLLFVMENFQPFIMKKNISLLQSLVWSVTCQTIGKYVDRFLSVAKAEVSCFDQTKVISAFMEANRNQRIFAAEKLKSEDSDYFKFRDCSNDESMIKVKNAFSTNHGCHVCERICYFICAKRMLLHKQWIHMKRLQVHVTLQTESHARPVFWPIFLDGLWVVWAGLWFWDWLPLTCIYVFWHRYLKKPKKKKHPHTHRQILSKVHKKNCTAAMQKKNKKTSTDKNLFLNCLKAQHQRTRKPVWTLWRCTRIVFMLEVSTQPASLP